jgi:apolipoprotein N-acyltransferase
MNTEPTRITGYVTLFITTLVALIVAFFPGFVTDAQRDAILACAVTLVPIGIFMIEFIRSKVYSPATADRLVANAAVTGQVPMDMTPPRG